MITTVCVCVMCLKYAIIIFDPDINIIFIYFKHITIAVNISERKSGIERTKKRKKRELVCFPTATGRSGVNRL